MCGGATFAADSDGRRRRERERGKRKRRRKRTRSTTTEPVVAAVAAVAVAVAVAGRRCIALPAFITYTAYTVSTARTHSHPPRCNAGGQRRTVPHAQRLVRLG